MVKLQRSKFDTRLRLAFAAATIAIAALAAASWQAAVEVRDAALAMARTLELSTHISDARVDALLIEVNSQSFRLTGDAAFLAARNAAIAALENSLQRVEQLTVNDPRQRERGARARALVDERAAIAQRVDQLLKTDGAAAAQGYIDKAPIRTTRERLFATLREMDEEEDRLLRMRSAEQSRARDLRHALSAASVLMLLGLLASTFVMVRRQIDERRQAEAALRASEEGLATTLQSISDAVLATDTEGRIVRMNPVAERLTGWPSAEARGRPVADVFRIVNEGTRAPVEIPVTAVLASGEVHGLANHTLLIARDGSERPIADSASPIRAVSGELTGVVLVFRDVSAERSAEKQIADQNAQLEQRVLDRTAQLRANEAQLQTVLENLGEGVVAAGLDGQVLQFNRAAIEMHGFVSAEEYLRRLPDFTDTFELASPDGMHLAVEQWPLTRVLRGELLHDLDVSVRHLVQHWQKIFQYSGMLARDAAGQPFLAILTIRDVTQARLAEQQMMDLNASLEQRVAERTAQLEEASRAKSDFLANMSHELRTPLNAIIGFSEMLKDGVVGQLEAKQRDCVADIFDAGTHLLALINDILDLSKIEAGMLQLDASAVDLPALLQASMLIVREKALAHRVRLDTRLDPALGTVLADERKLKQIVFNLLSNAVKFSPEGGTVTLSARRCSRSEVQPETAMPARLIALPPGPDREFLAITVEDGGIGIAEADLAKLYDRFSQIDSSVSRRHAGAGLGLSLVRRLAELHGGTVGVASRPGVGSRFSVWLPYREFAGQGEPALPAMNAPRQGAVAAQATTSSGISRPLALVVEDDDRMAERIAAQLRAEGFAVMRAATAEEGLARAAKRHPQLITLDIFLPHMSGWDFMQRLLDNPRLAATPVVIITVSEDLERGLALGARRVLHKPFTRAELVTALAGLVDARHDGAQPRVLVVDDNVKAVELVATVLEAEGCHVLRAYGGVEAIKVAKQAQPDLVILDLVMPEMSGFEVACALREDDSTVHIPILVLTAKDLDTEEHTRLNGKVQAVLAKTRFSASALRAELQRALPGPAPG